MMQFVGMSFEQVMAMEGAWVAVEPMEGYYDEAEDYEVEGYGAQVVIGDEFGRHWELEFSLDGICIDAEFEEEVED